MRGTPQQIIDKYNQLARDAQLSNDRVAFENFQQHSEHYTRMLAEAQREQDQRREQEMQHRGGDRPQGRADDDDGPERDERPHMNGHDGGHDAVEHRREERREDRFVRHEPEEERAPAAAVPATVVEARPSDVIDTGPEGDSTLVETPESRPARPRRRRRPQAEAAAPEGEQPRTDEPEVAE